MSTDINIKKKISIEEEGALLTADVNNINFVGPGVTASTLGNDVTVTVAGSIGGTVYYMNETVTQAPYKEFSSNPTSAAEQIIPATVAGGATATIAAYQTPVGVPNTTVIPAGLWQLFLHFNAGSAGQNWIIRPYVYKRDLGGIETLIFTADPQIVTGMSTTTTMYTCDGVFPNTVLLTTDRIVVKIDVENTSGVSQTVNFRTEGSQHYSVAATTLNQAISAGSVTSVSGTAPIVSSGGSSPAISIPQATALVDGYLSSSDWSVFNSKVGTNIYVGDGSLTGNRTVTMAANNLKFLGAGGTSETYFERSNGTGQISTIKQQSQLIDLTLADAANSVLVRLAANTIFTQIVDGATGFESNFEQAFNYSSINLFDASATLINSLSVGATGVSFNNNFTLPKVDGTIGQVLTTNGAGVVTWATSAGGLTYFIEARNTTAPNTATNVDSLSAGNGLSTTDVDIAIVPRANGAFLLDIPDNTTTGGNKRGSNAVDLQMSRTANTQVASGARSFVAGRNNTASADDSYAIGFGNTVNSFYGLVMGFQSNVSGSYAVGIGYQNIASGQNATAIGQGNTASAIGTTAIGWSNSASAQYATSIGGQNNIANIQNATVVGGSGNTASGAYSFTTGLNNLSSGTYAVTMGVLNTASNVANVSLGYQNSATGISSTAIGRTNTSSAENSIALGISNTASGFRSVSIGVLNNASGSTSYCFGNGNVANRASAVAIGTSSTAAGDGAIAIGNSVNTFLQHGRISFSSGAIGTSGDIQKSFYILKGRTTDAIPKTLTSENGGATTASIMVLQNNSVYRFKGTIVGKQTGTTNIGVWDVDGVIVRGANAAATTVTISNINLVTNTSSWGTPTLTADTTLGGLTLNAVGLAATNIQWIADIQTSEVIY